MVISVDAQLALEVARYRADPLGFVRFIFPWGEATLTDGTYNPLRNKMGPEPWQEKYLHEFGEHIRNNDERQSIGLAPRVWRSARSSGHGVGKSTLVAWLIIFTMATRANTRGVVTANTQHQLESKTWPELAKWHKLSLTARWFEWQATSYYFKLTPANERKNYMVNAITVSEDNSEAFAGLHNEQGTTLIIFDEASGIAPIIWQVAQGATTDGEVFFAVFGNPTQPSGEFADCFDLRKDMYNTGFVDSREVSHTNKEALNDIITMYGADSDEVKIRVYGRFPTQAYNGFISKETVELAQTAELTYDAGAALIMAVDVARFGDDEIVIGFRQGRDARTRKRLVFKGIAITRLAEICVEQHNLHRPDAIVIESTGIGAGLIDILRHTYHLKIVEVHPGAHSGKPEHYYRKRDELWALARDWLIEGGCIDNDPTFATQLTAIQYTLDRFEQKIKIESKEDMKNRTGHGSPDRADQFVLTFGVNLVRRDANLNVKTHRDRNQAVVDYDVFAYDM